MSSITFPWNMWMGMFPDRPSAPCVAEAAAILADVADEHRGIQGAAERATDESRGRFRGDVDGLIHRRDFGDRDTAVNCI